MQTSKFLSKSPGISLRSKERLRQAYSPTMPPPLHKFKPALLVENSNKNANGDTKEVFFTGSHGDVGGEWSLPGDLGDDESNDPVRTSDCALEWMIIEKTP